MTLWARNGRKSKEDVDLIRDDTGKKNAHESTCARRDAAALAPA
jgi:hypothetical protein